MCLFLKKVDSQKKESTFFRKRQQRELGGLEELGRTR